MRIINTWTNLNGKIIPIHQIGLTIITNFTIPEDDSVRLLFKVTEGLDYSKLYETYSTLSRNPAITPETLFRIIIYGNIKRIYSSRDLENIFIDSTKIEAKHYSFAWKKTIDKLEIKMQEKIKGLLLDLYQYLGHKKSNFIGYIFR